MEKMSAAIVLLVLTAPFLLFPQSDDGSPFHFLLRETQIAAVAEDFLIGPLHQYGKGHEELDSLARKVEKFYLEGTGKELLFTTEAATAIGRMESVLANGKGPGREVELVRIGVFSIRPDAGEASLPVRIDSGSGTLFLILAEEGTWRVGGASFPLYTVPQRSEYGQSPGKN
jgi:hypothetical protein